MPFDPREVKPGDVLSARWLMELARELRRSGNISVVPPLEYHADEAGWRLSMGLYVPVWIKLTSAGAGADAGKYAWTRQVPVSGGTWSNAPDGRTGTVAVDPAYEINANASVSLTPNPVVRAWRDPMSPSRLLFQAGSC